MIRLIATDLDGVLLFLESKKIYQDLLTAFKSAQLNGTYLVANTGRSVPMYEAIDWPPGFSFDFNITSNGVSIRDGQKLVHFTQLTNSCLQRAICCIERADFCELRAWGAVDGGIRYCPTPEASAKYALSRYTNPNFPMKEVDSVTHFIDLLRSTKVGRISIRTPELRSGIKNDELYIPLMTEKFDCWEFTGTTIYGYEQKGVNKGSTLAHLMSHLGIHSKEVMVLGDASNDLEAFKLCEGPSIAVGPKCDVLLPYATHHVDMLELAPLVSELLNSKTPSP